VVNRSRGPLCTTHRQAAAPAWGIALPRAAGTPKEIVNQLNGEIVRIVSAPELKERLATLGLDAVGSTPEAFAQQLRAEEEKWAKVIRAGNIKAPQ
jgi:tripartite-type tricarboxylate transporter receptor subunit TctC